MASKRSTRTIRPADQEQAIGVHDRRDDAATKRRLLLTAAAVVVVLTGAFAAFRVGGQISGRALQGMHSFPSIPLDSKVASGLQLAASNVTATLASKASGIASKAKTTAQGQSTQEIHSTAKEQLTAKQQSKSKWQNTVKSPASRKGSAGPVAFPWDFKMAKQTVCNDTCHKARDGRCDDGSTGEEDQVFCDLGTDCSDCGPWTFSVPSQQANQTLPIKLLHSRQIDVFVKNTSTVPSFQMAYTDPMKDVDVSGQMEHGGVVEMGLTMMWYKALKDKCIQRDGSRALVVDVGGNFGWYSIYAATLGCRVITWEPVPHFRAFLEYNRQLNHLEDLIDIRDTAVAEVSGVTYDLTVPQRGIWGTAGIGGLNIDGSVDNQGDYEMVTAMGERVDEVVAENVVLLKADVEGLEPGVIQSAKGLLESYKVDHVVMEYSPGAWEIHDKWDEYIDLANMLAYLLDLGYTLLHLQLMGCPKPKELKQVGKVWGGCNAIPEDLHPKSFRAAFGHNTNVWLMQDKKAFKVGTPVGVMALDQDLNEWYGQQPLKLGMGYRPCDLISPDVQVRHRCTCTNVTVCGAEAKLIETLAKQEP
ncbi:hypothetical protein WJX79_007618 [Trebouxia sp. C0005]